MAVNPLAIGGGVVAAAAVVGGGLYAGGVFGGGNTSNQGSGRNSGDSRSVTIQWHPLYEDTGYKNVSGTAVTVQAPYTDKYAVDYSKYLVGVADAETGKLPTKNDKWWEWSLNNRYKEGKKTATDEFAEAKTIDTWEKLKEVCKAAYQAEKTVTDGKIKAGTSDPEKKYREEDIWKFCSPVGSKIKTIKEANKESAYSSNNEFFGNAYKEELVAIEGNDEFWVLRQGEYDKADAATRGQVASKVKDWCSSSYSKSKTASDNNPKEEDVFKWCSIRGAKKST